MVDLLIFLILTAFSLLIPSSLPILKTTAIVTAFIALIRFIMYAKKVSVEVNEESKFSSNQSHKNYPYFEGKFIELIPMRTTSLIESPMYIRYIDMKTKEEVVRLTNNEAFLKESQRYTYVKVYYNGSYIVDVFPSER